MQVEMAQIKAGISRPGYPQQAIGVGLIIRTKTANRVHHLDELIDDGIEDTGIVGVGNKQRRRSLGNSSLDRFQARIAVLFGVERDQLIPGSTRASRYSEAARRISSRASFSVFGARARIESVTSAT